MEKKEKAEKLLAALEKSVAPPIVESDREAITEEERYMLRKIGLRMKPFLLLGKSYFNNIDTECNNFIKSSSLEVAGQ